MRAGWRFGHRLSGRHPRGFVRFAGLWVLVLAVLDDGKGEFLEFGEQCPDSFGVVEERLPGGELLAGEPAGDGLAADLAGPFGVGAVPGGRAGVAAAGRLAACVGADGEGAGQGRAGRGGELGGDLAQGRALVRAQVHARYRLRFTASRGFHSLVLWNDARREARWARRRPGWPATSRAGSRPR